MCTPLSLPSLISVTPSCVGCDDSHYSAARSGLGMEVRLGQSRAAWGGGSDIGRRCGECSPPIQPLTGHMTG